MADYFIIELIKITRSRYLWLFVFITPAVGCLIAYMTANGFQLKSNDASLFEMWNSILSFYFVLMQFIFMFAGGFFLITWQHQEHVDNTFKLYDIAPSDNFQAIQIRFLLFYLIYIIIIVATQLLSVMIIKQIWQHNYPDYPLTETTWSYIRNCLKAQVIMSFPIYLFLFILSIKIDKLSISVLALIVLIALSAISLPQWLFFRSLRVGLSMIRNIYGGNPLYTANDLSQVYLYNILWSVLLTGVLYYLVQRRKLFI